MEIVNPIQTPFADTVTEREIIEPSSENTGVVNWLHGFPADFSKSSGDGGKFVKRKTLNYILWYISAALKYFQKGGIALYNSAFSNGTYDKDSVLWFKRGDKYVLIQAVKNTNVEPNNEDLIKPESDTSKNWRMYKLLGYNGSTLTIDEPFTSNENVTLEKNLSVNGNFQLGSGSRASGCPTPNNPNDFANKQYVDDKTNIHIFAGGELLAQETVSQYIRTGVDFDLYTATKDCMLNISIVTSDLGGASNPDSGVFLRVKPVGASNYRKIAFTHDTAHKAGESIMCTFNLRAGDIVNISNNDGRDVSVTCKYIASELR